MEDKEEDVSSYWMALRKREVTENWKRKACIALLGELALTEALVVSEDRMQNGWFVDVDTGKTLSRFWC